MENQMKSAAGDAGVDEDAEWQWCGQCGRASVSKIAYNCGYEGCHAGIESMFTWKYVRGINPDLPAFPVQGVVYSITRSK